MLLCSDLVKKATERDSLTDDNITILDNATGTGAIPSLIIQLLEKGRIPTCDVIAADKEIKYIEQLKNRKEVAGSAWDRVEIQQFDMQVSMLELIFLTSRKQCAAIRFCIAKKAPLTAICLCTSLFRRATGSTFQ